MDYVPKSWIRGQRILLLQDSMRTGASTNDLKNRVESYGAEVVDTAAFVVHRSCQFVPSIVHPKYYALSDGEYGAATELLQDAMRRRVYPVEIDRPSIRIKLREQIGLDFWRSLRTQFTVEFTSGDPSRFPGRVTCVVSSPVDEAQLRLAPFLGSCLGHLVRLDVFDSTDMLMSPLLSYEVAPTGEIAEADCREVDWAARFCEIGPLLIADVASRCFDCALLNMSLQSGILFSKALIQLVTEQGVSVEAISWNKSDVELCYPVLGEELSKRIDQAVKSLSGEDGEKGR